MSDSLPPVGLQPIVLKNLYSIEDPKVLDHLQAFGYDAVECLPADPARMKRMLDERGMHHAGGHVLLPGLLEVDKIIESMKILGGRHLCNSGLMKWHERSLQDYRDAIRILNSAGHRLKEAGVSLHYHNHEFEFEPVADCPGKTGMDILLDELDSSCVDLCIDVAWVSIAGHDPLEWLLQHKGRFTYLHFKDHDGSDWTELGRGKVNFDPLMELLRQSPEVAYVIIEQDESKIDPLESIRISRQFLKNKYGY